MIWRELSIPDFLQVIVDAQKLMEDKDLEMRQLLENIQVLHVRSVGRDITVVMFYFLINTFMYSFNL